MDKVVEYFDLMDLKVLGVLIQEPIPVMKLTKIIGLAHANLLKRLKKLESGDFISKTKGAKTNQSLIKVTEKGMALFSIYSGDIKSFKISDNGDLVNIKIEIPKSITFKGNILK